MTRPSLSSVAIVFSAAVAGAGGGLVLDAATDDEDCCAPPPSTRAAGRAGVVAVEVNRNGDASKGGERCEGAAWFQHADAGPEALAEFRLDDCAHLDSFGDELGGPVTRLTLRESAADGRCYGHAVAASKLHPVVADCATLAGFVKGGRVTRERDAFPLDAGVFDGPGHGELPRLVDAGP